MTYTTKDDDDWKVLQISIKGAITSSDPTEINNLLTKFPKHAVLLYIESKGGDVESAMRIGRLMRNHEAEVTTGDHCLSSCVLIYGGGVKRVNLAQFMAEIHSSYIPPTGIGIHRFYFSHLSPSASTADITAARNKLKQSIRAYLSEMNVSERLLDEMEAVPPEKVRILTVRELHRFGLGAKDPVYDEKVVAKLAASYGLSSSEYRRRSSAAPRYCEEVAATKKAATKKKSNSFDGLLDIYSCLDDFIRSGGR